MAAEAPGQRCQGVRTLLAFLLLAATRVLALQQPQQPPCDAYPELEFASVVRSNLGGFGPDPGEEGLVIRAFDPQIRRHLHLVINAGGSYRPFHEKQNGLHEHSGTINIRSGTVAPLTFSFEDAATGQPARMPRVAFTFLDLDQCEDHRCVEFISIHNVSAYRLSPTTELMVMRPMAGERSPTATFYSTTVGTFSDNARSKESLTQQQMNRGVSAAFHHMSQISLTFGSSQGKGARYLNFMGMPGLLCSGKAATAANNFSPAGVPPPVRPLPMHELPMPVGWTSWQVGGPSLGPNNVSGTITIENIDWSLLQSHQSLAVKFEDAVRRGIAIAAGGGISESDVVLTLKPGTIVVRATVLPHEVMESGKRQQNGSALLRARLQDDEKVCETATQKVRAIDGIRKVTTGAIRVTHWHLLKSHDAWLFADHKTRMGKKAYEAASKGTVSGVARLENISYSLLVGSPTLLMELKAAVTAAMASVAGPGATSADVDLGLFAGAVVAGATVRLPPHLFGNDSRSPPLPAAHGATPVSVEGMRPPAGMAMAVLAARSRLRQNPEICREVAKEVKRAEGIDEVTTGPVVCQDWHLLPEQDELSVQGSMSVHNVDYELLAANPVLQIQFKDCIRKALAEVAGGGTQHVKVALFAGNVVLRAMVSPTLGPRIKKRFESGNLGQGGETLCQAVTHEVRQVKGIHRVANVSMQYHGKGKHAALLDAYPNWRQMPSDGVEDSDSGAVVSCTAEGLDYTRLLLNPVLLSNVEQAVRIAVAKQVGGTLTPGDLMLSLSVGSVVARVTVVPPADPAAVIRDRLSRSEDVEQRVWEEVQKIEGLEEVEVESDPSKKVDDAEQEAPRRTPSPPSHGLKYWGYALILLGVVLLACLAWCHRRRACPAVVGAGRSQSRDVRLENKPAYIYLPVEEKESERVPSAKPVEVFFRDGGETRAVKFRYRDHGMRLSKEGAPKVEGFLVKSYAKEKGVKEGWAVTRVGGTSLERGDSGERAEELLRSALERLPPAPLLLEFDTGSGRRSFLAERQPLGLEFTKTAPFAVEHFKPDSLAREWGVEIGWTLQKVGTASLDGNTQLDSLLRCLDEGLHGLQQDPSGPSVQVDFLDGAGRTRSIFFQRRPLGLKLASPERPAPSQRRRSGAVVEDFDFNSYARDRGVEAGWAVARVNEVDTASERPEKVQKLLTRLTGHLPLWPLRIDFLPADSARGSGSRTRTFYFEHQPLGLEFTSQAPIRVEHFKPDSIAEALGVREQWSVVRVGDRVVMNSTSLQQLMGLIQSGLDHLPQEPKGLRIDFQDPRGRRKRCQFLRRPLGFRLARHSPPRVEGFEANSYALERGVEAGWTVVRVGEQELLQAAPPQDVEALIEEHSAPLPLWPLRMDFDTGQGSVRTLYLEHQPQDLSFAMSPPFRVLRNAGAANVGLDWTVVRAGHLVVDAATDYDTLLRAFREGSKHLPAAE